MWKREKILLSISAYKLGDVPLKRQIWLFKYEVFFPNVLDHKKKKSYLKQISRYNLFSCVVWN